MDFLRCKPILPYLERVSHLHPCLGVFELTLLGIGAIIGAGIFVITGVAAATQAGPAIILSYVVSGLACVFTALSYAELAACVGGCGSAYGYAYAGFGELIAWIIGWNLVLEYGVSAAAVAIGWAGYMNDALRSVGIILPDYLLKGPLEGGVINLLAMLIVFLVAMMLSIGIRQSARFNAMMVLIKLGAIGLFIAVAAFHVDLANWKVFMPFGWSGVVHGAALIFFAYIGFDAVATAAEEANNPQRDLPISIMLSLGVCTILYILVASLLTLIAPYESLNNASPVSNVLLNMGYRVIPAIIAVGAIAGLTTVILVMYYGLTRILLAMSRDGLLPAAFAKVSAQTGTPVRVIHACGGIIILVAGLTPIDDVAELVNIGTLSAFMIVCAGVVVLRYKRPDLPRPFVAPFSPYVPIAGVLFCFYLMVNLPFVTWMRFLIWSIIGFLIYFLYSRYHSLLNESEIPK